MEAVNSQNLSETKQPFQNTQNSSYPPWLQHNVLIHTCLFVHKFIVVGKEGSELGRSV